MERKCLRNDPRRTAAGGFSLVELLTVIAIIVLLIGILVPAVNKVRVTAKTTTTSAMIGTLSTALDVFRADQQVGGAYPPSAPDGRNSAGRLSYRVASPYENTLENGPSGFFPISGAGLLVWALAGADLGGTPGFRTFRPDTMYWSQDADDDPDDDPPGAYALDDVTLQPLHPRAGPFVDLSKVDVARWNPNAENGGSFEIPAEIEARESLGTPLANMPERNYPMFVDPFGGPILYFRADPAGMQAVDESPNRLPSQPQFARRFRGIYHFLDNGALISDVGSGPGTNQEWVILRPRSTAEPHNLRYIAPNQVPPVVNEPLDGFWEYVRNKDIQAKVAPHKPDSFLLISAGADGIYGTGDDVANFEHNGAELTSPERE